MESPVDSEVSTRRDTDRWMDGLLVWPMTGVNEVFMWCPEAWFPGTVEIRSR
jgi:hypothetical protein